MHSILYARDIELLERIELCKAFQPLHVMGSQEMKHTLAAYRADAEGTAFDTCCRPQNCLLGQERDENSAADVTLLMLHVHALWMAQETTTTCCLMKIVLM